VSAVVSDRPPSAVAAQLASTVSFSADAEPGSALYVVRVSPRVGVSHDVALPGDELFFSGAHLHGGPAPVRRYLPELIELICTREIDPGRVFGPGGSPSGRPRQVGTCLPPAAQSRSAALSRAACRVRWSRSARLGAERAASA
jgi:hypothetical protein